MTKQIGGRKPAYTQKTTPFNLHHDIKKRGSAPVYIGNRFLFVVFTAFFICLSISLPSSWGRQLEYDLKLQKASVQAAARVSSASAFTRVKLPVVIYLDEDRTDDSSIYDLKYKPKNITLAAYGKRNVAARTVSRKLSPAYMSKFYVDSESFFALNAADNIESYFGNASSGVSVDSAFADAAAGARYIVLDAGHGGLDPGSIEKGVCEKDIALDVALRVAELLAESGIDYVLTRPDDETVGLERRHEYAKGAGARMLISVHCDWYEQKQINGTSTIYDVDNESSKELAALIQTHITPGLGTADRSVHPHNNILLLRDLPIPAVVVELGFFSNEHDFALMKTETFKEQAAQNLTNGILAALEKFDIN